METTERGKVSLAALGKESCRVLQGGKAPKWSLVFVPKLNQNPFKLVGLQQRCVTKELEVVWPVPARESTFGSFLDVCLYFFMLKNNEIRTSV